MEEDEVCNHIYNPIEAFDDEIDKFFEQNKTHKPETIFDTQQGVDDYVFQMQKYNTGKKEMDEEAAYEYRNRREHAKSKINQVIYGDTRPVGIMTDTDNLVMDNKFRIGEGADSLIIDPMKKEDGTYVRDKTRRFIYDTKVDKDRIGYQSAPVRDDPRKNANWEKMAQIRNPKLRGLMSGRRYIDEETLATNRHRIGYNALVHREARRCTIPSEGIMKRCIEEADATKMRTKNRVKSKGERIIGKVEHLLDDVDVVPQMDRNREKRDKTIKPKQEWDLESEHKDYDKISDKKCKMPQTKQGIQPVHIPKNDAADLFKCSLRINAVEKYIQNKANIIKHKPIIIDPEIYNNTDGIFKPDNKMPEFDREYAGPNMRPKDKIETYHISDPTNVNDAQTKRSKMHAETNLVPGYKPKSSRPRFGSADFDIKPDTKPSDEIAKSRIKYSKDKIPKQRIHKIIQKGETCSYKEVENKRRKHEPLDKFKIRKKKMNYADEAVEVCKNTDLESSTVARRKPNTRKTRDCHTKLNLPDDTDVYQLTEVRKKKKKITN